MAAVPPWLRLGAGAAAAALIVTATGDVLLLALALAITTGSRAAVGPLLACLALAVRAGSVTLAASAGAQAVLGPAGVAGPPLSAASAWVGGVAFVAAARRGPASVPFGLAAGFAVAGPAIASASDLLLRVGAAALGVAVAAGMARLVAPLVPDGARSWTAVAAGMCSFVLAAVA